MKVAITTSSFAQFSRKPLDLLEQAGVTHTLNPHGRKITEDEAIDLLDGCIGVVAGTEPLTARVINSLPELKVISRCGVGMDSVDQKVAREKGIAVRLTPFGPTLAVAELTLGLALDLMRQVSRMDRELRQGKWKKRMGNTLSGKRLGIIGFGRIGQAVAKTFAPMGVGIAYNDPLVTHDAHPQMGLDELLVWADIITLHCSRPECGCTVLGSRELALLRSGSWVINCGRGGLVDEQALYNSLATRHLAGAAVDVFMDEPYTGPLRDLDNIILTPHIGSYAQETRIQMEIDAVINLLNVLGLNPGAEEAC